MKKDHEEPKGISEFLDKMGVWMEKVTTPEFRKFKAQQINWLLAEQTEKDLNLVDCPEEFVFSDDTEKQFAIISAFLDLYQAYTALVQSQYYFRRFPFKGLPISEEEHLRNICEFYFSQFSKIYSRIKRCMKTLEEAYPEKGIDQKKFPQIFYENFRREITDRNEIQHSESFKELSFDRMYLVRILSDKFFPKAQYKKIYRKVSREWSTRAKKRAHDVEKFVDYTARIILLVVDFL